MVETGYPCERAEANQMVGSYFILLRIPNFYHYRPQWIIIEAYLSHAFHDSLKFASRWYAKRFLHPDIVAPYDYIFMWDEDLGVEHFDAEE